MKRTDRQTDGKRRRTLRMLILGEVLAKGLAKATPKGFVLRPSFQLELVEGF